MVSEVCTSCLGQTTIIDPISQEEEPYTCPDCGGTGKAENQITPLEFRHPRFASATPFSLTAERELDYRLKQLQSGRGTFIDAAYVAAATKKPVEVIGGDVVWRIEAKEHEPRWRGPHHDLVIYDEMADTKEERHEG